jgi:DegV family protein with EDD domain
MAKVEHTLDRLDGNQLFLALSAGLLAVRHRQDYLNRINVFPVPDGDTGTNIAVTLSHALEAARISDSAGETLTSIATAALVGARGSSGIIVAQFLGGFAETLRGFSQVTVDSFVEAVENAASRAWESVTEPAEGTILSVMRAWAEALRSELDQADSLAELLVATSTALRAALEETGHELAALREAGVVDAGACGFVELVAGMESFVDGRAPAAALSGAAGPLPTDEAPDLHESGEGRYRYCTEALLVTAAVGHEILRTELESLGDNLIVAGDKRRARVHIHTDRPAEVFRAIAPAGRIVQQKVDDMRLQFEVAHRRKYPIAIVTDSICDLPRELLDLHQIQVVPLHVHFGDDEYLDRLTIDSERFFELVERSPQLPSSSQPTTSSFARLYAYLATYYDSIIAVHVASKLSGTFGTSAKAAASLAGEKKISVIDSGQVSGSLGLVVLRAAETVAAGASHDDAVAEIESFTGKAEILVSVRKLENMVRGGRVKPVAGAIGRALNLKPIVSLDSEGKSTLYGKAFSVRRNQAKIVEMVARRHQTGPLRYYAVEHAQDESAARELGARLEEELGFPPLFIGEISSVVAVHAGRGALSVVTMQE